jgi:hypothetical protein
MRFLRRRRAVEEGPREPPQNAPATREGAVPGEERRPVSEARGGEAAPRASRGGLGWRTRDAGAAAVGAAGAGILMLARLVMLVATLIALLIGLAIILRDVDANASNTIVKAIHDGANFFAGAFTDMIKFNGRPKLAITVNWGIALLVYLVVGGVVARMIARVGRGGVRFERSRRAAPTV